MRRQFVVPLYVGLCLVLGGSAQGIWFNLVLQVGAIALLAWAALTRSPSATTGSGRVLGWIIAGAVVLTIAQLVPLPPALWTALPGREPIELGFSLLGQDLPWLPWSMTPYQTIAAALALLPPIAIVAGIVRLGAYRSTLLSLVLVAVTIAGVILGAVQVATKAANLYPFTSPGQAAGFFANANYMGTLLLAAIPYLAALYTAVGKGTNRSRKRAFGLRAIAASGLAVLLLGLALNRSTAALLLSLPVLIASAVLLLDLDDRVRGWVVGGTILAGVAGCLAFATLPTLSSREAAVSVETRHEIYARSLDVAESVFPAGAGIGSFPRLYPRFEDPNEVDRTFVNHVHNDYLEALIEGGLPAVALIAVFLLWWARRSVQIWKSATPRNFTRAATIASAAILAHSAVDFPVRTAAIAAVLAMSVALMAEPRSRQSLIDTGARARPARHLALD